MAENWFVDKVLPPALLVLATSIGGASWTIWNNLNELKTLVVNQDKEIQTTIYKYNCINCSKKK